MSSERAGVHTGGTLNREQAEQIIRGWIPQAMHSWAPQIVDALEACVVPDPRWEQIEALCAEGDVIDGMVPAAWIRGVISGDPHVR